MPRSGGRYITDFSNPSAKQEAVNASDTMNFTNGVCRGIYVGTGGTVPVVAADDSVSNWVVPDSYIIPAFAKRVNATGLVSAASMLALF